MNADDLRKGLTAASKGERATPFSPRAATPSTGVVGLSWRVDPVWAAKVEEQLFWRLGFCRIFETSG
jgi:hypothetical protein